MNWKISTIASTLLVTSTFAAEADNTITAEEKAAGWELLFDGESMDQWKNYKKETISEKWTIKDNAMHKGQGAGDVVTKKSYKNFEFKCDWKISKKGNSGIFVRVDNTGKKIYSKSIEMQVLDNATKPSANTAAGAVYDMIDAPEGVSKAQGEWNRVHIICDGKKMSFSLNGVKTGEFEIGTAKWDELLKKSKFATWTGFGMAESGPIGLQEHGNPVWFKNLKIKELK